MTAPGKGPFTVKKPAEIASFITVLDAEGGAFCHVEQTDCVGGDLSAAKARATRIAEALNAREGHAKPTPYVDDAGNLCAPAGFCFVASGNNGVEMVPLLNVVMAPGK